MITRIFLILAILGTVAAFVGGWRLKEDRNKLRTDLATKVDDNTKLTGENGMQKGEIEAKKKEIKAAEQKIAAANAETESAKKDLESQKIQVRETQDKLTRVSHDLDDKKTEIEKFKSALPPGMGLEEVQAKLKEFADEKASLEQEKKIITDQITSQAAKIKDLEDKLKLGRDKKMPTGLTGHIIAINTEWNFVVLDIGASQGVVEEATMIVYRDGNLIGKIKITSVEPSIAIGDILPDWKKADIREGDSVVF